MHQRLRTGEATRWYLTDVAPGVIASLGVSLLLLRVLTFGSSRIETSVQLAVVGAIVMAATLLAIPFTRSVLADRFKSRRPRTGTIA
jgi:hypothetical protein